MYIRTQRALAVGVSVWKLSFFLHTLAIDMQVKGRVKNDGSTNFDIQGFLPLVPGD